MDKNKEQKQTGPEVGEDATQYGEFISTYFAWIPLPKQKEKAEEMADMTKKEKMKKKGPSPISRNKGPSPI